MGKSLARIGEEVSRSPIAIAENEILLFALESPMMPSPKVEGASV
jgi:hypothetical protein